MTERKPLNMKRMFRPMIALAALLALSALPAIARPMAPPPANPIRQWGLEDIRHIDAAFWIPTRGLYADEITPGQPPSANKPAFLWGCGVQLSALNAAARLDRAAYVPEVHRYITALDDYWVVSQGIGGYEVLPKPRPPDRFYDDNEWIVLDLADAYDLTRDPKILQKAQQTFRFVLSGEDGTLGGGIYWHEKERNTKNTCSNAPAIVAALRLYQITHEPAYLTTARRLYAWTNAHLQDTDGLFFDHVDADGTVHKEKWSYNSALMIRANALLSQVTHNKRCLTEAQRIARAAEARWVQPETGAIADNAAFAHLLSESFLFLYDQDHDPHHLAVVHRALDFLHARVRDADGNYGDHWDKPRKPQSRVPILAEASGARGNLIAAPYFAGRHASVLRPVSAR